MRRRRKIKRLEGVTVTRFFTPATGERSFLIVGEKGAVLWDGPDRGAALRWLTRRGLHQLRADAIRDWAAADIEAAACERVRAALAIAPRR